MKTKILIGGGSGLVGSHLRTRLSKETYEVKVLSRSIANKSSDFLQWDPARDSIELKGFAPDVVINLAGAGIADKLWTKSRKKEIISSRVESNKVLVRLIEEGLINPKIFLSASAIGIYGDRGDEILTHESAIGDRNSFMVECCELWERSIDPIINLTKSVFTLRIGLVLSSKGGALPKILQPMNFGIAAYFGNGKQFYPWIHIDDLASQIIFLITKTKEDGIYNGVAPESLQLGEFTRRTKQSLGKKALLLPVPAFALNLIPGKMATMLLNSNRVSPNRFLEQGFKFQFETLENAIVDIVNRRI